jgi:hypothetical protein
MFLEFTISYCLLPTKLLSLLSGIPLCDDSAIGSFSNLYFEAGLGKATGGCSMMLPLFNYKRGEF